MKKKDVALKELKNGGPLCGPVQHSALPWEEVNFINHDGSQIKSRKDIVALLTESVMKGDGLYLAGVSVPGDDVVICYTGNGPKAKANASFIVEACNNYEKLQAKMIERNNQLIKANETNADLVVTNRSLVLVNDSLRKALEICRDTLQDLDELDWEPQGRPFNWDEVIDKATEVLSRAGGGV